MATRTRTTKTTPATGPQHNGRLIVGKKIELRKVGGEFSEDLLVANPALLDGVKVGGRLTLAIDVVCIDEHYPAEDRKEPDDGGVWLKLVFDPTGVTVIDRTLVASVFDAQTAAVQKARDDAAGATTLEEQIRESLRDEHDAGKHRKLQEGCEACEAESALEAAGK